MIIDFAQPLSLFRSLHRGWTVRQHLCQGALLWSVRLRYSVWLRHRRLFIHVVISDAAALVRTIFQAVKYIHDCGIVHRRTILILLPICLCSPFVTPDSNCIHLQTWSPNIYSSAPRPLTLTLWLPVSASAVWWRRTNFPSWRRFVGSLGSVCLIIYHLLLFL